MHLEENLNKEFEDDTENKSLMYLFAMLFMATRCYQLIKWE